MSHPVFISYARSTSRQHAEALYRELEELAFFDTSDIETGEQFPEVLVDALLDAKVVVVFVDERYFQRWYCRKELETALKPFEILSTQSGHSHEMQSNTLDGIILALPPDQPGSVTGRLLHNLPPRIGTANWPMADDTGALATLIRNRVNTTQYTIGESLETLKQRAKVRNALLEESALPPPSDLKSVRHALQGMPVSLRKGFVGRANELWTTHTALSGYEGEPEPAVALFAHGGFGKTRLAAEYVQRYGSVHFPGGLFWINAERGKEGLEEQFYAILQAIKPNIPSLKDLRDSGVPEAVATAMVNAVTEASRQGRVLIVVDNVPETQPAPLSTWCPAMGTAAVLATSRRNLALSPQGIKEVTVPPLTLTASIELLTRQIDRRTLPNEDWGRIAEEWVGRFPLALELLNTTLQAGAMTPQQLLRKAMDSKPTAELDAQMEVLQEAVPQGMLRGVTEALQISYEQLSPAAQKAAHLLAQLGPAPIPESLIAVFPSDLLSPAVRTMLRTRSIVMPVTGSTVPMFGTMHRVLADFLRSQSGGTEEDIQLLSESLQTLMTPEACRDPNQWAMMIACAPHAEKLFTVLQDLAPEQYGHTVVKLRLLLGTLHSAQGLYERAREMEEKAVTYAMTNLGEEHPSTSISAWNYLNTLLETGDTETARKVQRQYLLWLLEKDPLLLGDAQQQIRAGVAQLLESEEDSQEE
ncbi:MAG: toll/interleukin-1 receptor domain-containing protein [Nitrospirota bacterium]